MSYRQKMHRQDVMDMLDDLEIPRIHVHPISINIANGLMLMPKTHGPGRNEDGIKDLMWLVIVESLLGNDYKVVAEFTDMFDLQDWLINEYEKYK